MSDPLALKYRPRTFSDTVGQRPVRAVLRQMVLQDRLPPALLFAGPRGTGKTTTGRILAATLNCESRDLQHADPCGECPSCKAIWSGQSVDVLEVDAASNGLVADIRHIREMVMYSVGGRYRIILLDEAHSMSKEAFNALLKTLEEPPPATVFVLLTTEPNRVIDTIVSRCMLFEFVRVSPSDISSRLAHIAELEHIEVTQELLAHIADRSDGAMRNAVMTLDQISRVNVKTVQEFRLLMGDEDVAPALLRALATGDVAKAWEVYDGVMARTGDVQTVAAEVIKLLSQLMVIHCGGDIRVQGEPLEERKRLASLVPPDRVFAVSRVLWDFKTRLRSTDDTQAMFGLALILMGEELGKSQRAAAAPQVQESLSVADLKAIAMR